MARLPSELYLFQGDDGQAVLFEDGSEREITRFDPASPQSAGRALEAIAAEGRLSDEDKSFACFWAGYFAFYASYPEFESQHAVSLEETSWQVTVTAPDGSLVTAYDGRDGSAAAQGQFPVHLSEALDAEAKRWAHFWCGYYWGMADD